MGHKSKQLFISTRSAEDGEESEGNPVESSANTVSVGNPGRRESGLAVCWQMSVPVLEFFFFENTRVLVADKKERELEWQKRSMYSIKKKEKKINFNY